MPAPRRVEIGDVLADKYEIVEILGAGGMGVVLHAVHRGLGQHVAIKMLLPELLDEPEIVTRFEREARAAARLKSRHTVKVTDVDATDDGRPFMVMELLVGHDLDVELGREGKLDIEEAVTYVLQACSAMAEAHAMGIVHRDLKPHNLFLAYEEDDISLKVLDFGISKILQGADKNITQTASALGTPLYMSPEQIRSAKHVDQRADIWSLGVILYEALAGRPPFDGESATAVIAAISVDTPDPLHEVRPDVPLALSDVVMRALEKSPERRWSNVEVFAEALAPFGQDGSFRRTSLRSLPAPRPAALSDAQRVESAPALAATQKRETNRSWETLGLRRSLGRGGKWLIAASLSVAMLSTGALLWVTGSGDTDARDTVPAAPAAPSSTSAGREPQATSPPAATEIASAPAPSVVASASAASSGSATPPTAPAPRSVAPKSVTPKSAPPKPPPIPTPAPAPPKPTPDPAIAPTSL